jgi:hypothetical protein
MMTTNVPYAAHIQAQRFRAECRSPNKGCLNFMEPADGISAANGQHRQAGQIGRQAALTRAEAAVA